VTKNKSNAAVDIGSPTPARPTFLKRLGRAFPVIGVLVLMTWVFGHTGILHKLQTVVSDAKMRLNAGPTDSPVAIVDIDDSDYRDLFGGTSPLNPHELRRLLLAVAKGKPAVIGVDIDTSDAKFGSEPLFDSGSTIHVVWERELREIPEEGLETRGVSTLPILGGRRDIDPATNSSGLALLIDDSEDKVTRRYRRFLATKDGLLPSFPSAIVEAYGARRQQPPSTEDLVIRYAGDREGSHHLHLGARKVFELSRDWPASSPIKNKIVLVGGSYLGQDRHETPLGPMTGLGVMANAVETELAGGGERPPSRWVAFLLELFEAFVLIVLFHSLRFHTALGCSVVLVPLMALFCSFLAYGNGFHFPDFSFVLIGLLVFELYEHFRRKTIPEVFEKVAGSRHS
jgi:CHASE2 domain-containing sensor protein